MAQDINRPPTVPAGGNSLGLSRKSRGNRAPKLQRRGGIKPKAAPVAAYVRPPDPPRSNLHQLASALQNLSSDIAGAFKQQEEQQQRQDALRGQMAAYKENEQGYAEGVRQGLISPNESPAFLSHYKQTQGLIAGQKLQTGWAAEYSQWDGKDTGTDEQFDAFFQDYLQRNIDTNDPEMFAGMQGAIRQLQQNAYSKFSADRSKSLYKRSLQAHSASSGQIIDNRDAYVVEPTGEASPTGPDDADHSEIDTEALHGSLMLKREEALAVGVRASDLDKEHVDLVTAKALEYKDAELLGLLDKQIPGEDHTFSDTPYGRDQRLKAATVLERILIKDEQEEEDDGSGVVTLEAQRWLSDNPGKTLPDDIIRKGEKFDPLFRQKAIKWRQAFSSGEQQEDPQAILKLRTEIYQGAGIQAVNRAANLGIIKSPDTLKAMQGLAEHTTDKTRKEMLGGLAYKNAKAKIQQQFQLDALTGEQSLVSDDGIQAQHDLDMNLMEWRRANPKAEIAELEEAKIRIISATLQSVASISAPPSETPTPSARQAEDESMAKLAEYQEELRNQLDGEAKPGGEAEPLGEAKLEGQTQPEGGQPQPVDQQEDQQQSRIRDAKVKEWFETIADDPTLQLITQRATATGSTPEQVANIVMHERVADWYERALSDEAQQQIQQWAQRRDVELETAKIVGFVRSMKQAAAGTAPTQEQTRPSPTRARTIEEQGQSSIGGQATLDGQAQSEGQAALEGQSSSSPAPSIGGEAALDGDDIGQAVPLPERNPIRLGERASVSEDAEGNTIRTIPKKGGSPFDIALGMLGTHEVKHKATLQAFLKKFAGPNGNIDPSVIPWCAHFTNAVLGAGGYEGTGSGMARSFLESKSLTKVKKPVKGDVVVIQRGGKGSWKGHVGLFAGFTKKAKGKTQYVRVLGGNQSNKVSIKLIPASRVLGYRRPSLAKIKTAALQKNKE